MSLTQTSRVEASAVEWGKEYWPAFRRHVFSLIQMGYQRLDRDHAQSADEEEITGELHKIISDLLDEGAPKWADFYSIHEEPPVHSETRKGKRRRRLDLRFERLGSRPRPHYEFECKRLCKGKSGVADYFGAEGMSHFLTGEYARHWPEAGMLGYVQSGTVGEWETKLSSRLVESKVQTLPDGYWHRVSISDDLDTYTTAHPRAEALGSIRVFHALLALQHTA